MSAATPSPPDKPERNGKDGEKEEGESPLEADKEQEKERESGEGADSVEVGDQGKNLNGIYLSTFSNKLYGEKYWDTWPLHLQELV